jgi:WD40 repeat protein
LAAFSPDNQRLLTVSRDRSVRIWKTDDLNDRPMVFREAVPYVAMVHAEFAPDDNRLLLIPGVPLVPQADRGADTKTQPHALERPPIPDSKFWVRILSIDGSKTIELVHQEPLITGTFDPQGERVLTVTMNGQVLLWNARTGERLRIFESPGNPARWAAFAPDGSHVLTRHATSAVVWDVATGQRVLSVNDCLHRPTLSAVVAPPYRPYSRNGKWFAALTRESGGQARIWATDLFQAGLAAAPRTISDEERARFSVLGDAASQ